MSHCQIIAFFEDLSFFRNAVTHPDFSFFGLYCKLQPFFFLFSALWVLLKPGCFAYSKTRTSTKHLQHLLLPIMTSSESDLLAATGTLSGTYCLCTGFTMSHPKEQSQKNSHPIHLLANPTFQRQLLGLQSALETSHSMILFVRCKAWQERLRSETTCTYLCPRTPGASV